MSLIFAMFIFSAETPRPTQPIWQGPDKGGRGGKYNIAILNSSFLAFQKTGMKQKFIFLDAYFTFGNKYQWTFHVPIYNSHTRFRDDYFPIWDQLEDI